MSSGIDFVNGLSVLGIGAPPVPAGDPPSIINICNDGDGLAAPYFGINLTSFGAGIQFHSCFSRGTKASPSAIHNGDAIGSWGGRGYDGSAISQSAAALQMKAAENWTTSANGTYLTAEHTPLGTTNRIVGWTLQPNGDFVIGPQSGNFTGSGSLKWFYGANSPAGMGVQSDGGIGIYMNRISTDGEVIEFRRNNNTVGSITVTSSATAFNTTSDARLKDKGAPIESGAIVDAVQPCNFKWKESGEADFGFIAQELHGIVPLAVHVGNADAPEQPRNEDFAPWGVDCAKLVPILWAEVRTLRMRLAAAGI